MSSFTGISFPFRIGVKGGVAMSTTSKSDVPHIEESMEQILSTKPMERGMEFDFNSELDTSVFSPNDDSIRYLIAYQIKNALKREDRIKVKSVVVRSDEINNNYVIADISYTVLAYNEDHSFSMKVGEI